MPGKKSRKNEFPLLAGNGLYAADIRGDGNCLFNALSDQMYGHQEEHLKVRAGVIEYMRAHADYYKQFVEVERPSRYPKRKNAGTYASAPATAPTTEQIDQAFEDHITRMARGGTWGDNIEIAACAKLYNVDVAIYQTNERLMICGGDPNVQRPVLHVAYHDWEHYSSIRNVGGPHTGLPHVKMTYSSPEEEAFQTAQLEKGPKVMPWMIEQVMSSLPYLAEKSIVKRHLEEANGNVDAVLSKLLDAEERASVSSGPGSSSVERDQDSGDDGSISGPKNKKQDRRLSRASRATLAAKGKVPRTPLPISFSQTTDEGEEDLAILAAQKPLPAESDDEWTPPSEMDDEEYDEEADGRALQPAILPPQYTNQSLRTSQSSHPLPSSSLSTSISQTSPIATNGTLRAKSKSILANSASTAASVSKPIPAHRKKPTARERKELKKVAQKAAARERKLGMASANAANAMPANDRSGVFQGVALTVGGGRPPAIEMGIKTLYI